jgi:GrpB-like predicted nucleotidyltransferase (UPF0157 family)
MGGYPLQPLVVPHDPRWPQAFAREARAILGALGEGRITLDHIGSTAIPGILAKPIIDMLGEVAEPDLIDWQTPALEGLGYQAMGEFGIAGRRYFRKHDGNGQRSHHLHVFATGSPHIERHIAFRDYLRAHPDRATAYSRLKAAVTARDGLSMDDYMDAKAPFIAEVEALALDWFRRTRGRGMAAAGPGGGGGTGPTGLRRGNA